MNKVKAAVIGLGKKGLLYDLEDEKRIYPSSHVGAFKECKEIELVAVCDTDRDKLDTFLNNYDFKHTKGHQRFDNLLSSEICDIISVATPVETHYEVVKEITEWDNPKVIFVEKPIARTIREAWDMIELCTEKGKRLIVNHSRRWDSRWIFAHNLLRKISPVRHLIGYCSGDVLEAGVHMADLFRWFSDNPDVKETFISFKGPSYYPFLLFELDIIGWNGRMRIIDNGREIQIYEIKDSKHYTGIKELELELRMTPPLAESPMLRAAGHLADVFLKIAEPTCSGIDGLLALAKTLEWRKES